MHCIAPIFLHLSSQSSADVSHFTYCNCDPVHVMSGPPFVIHSSGLTLIMPRLRCWSCDAPHLFSQGLNVDQLLHTHQRSSRQESLSGQSVTCLAAPGSQSVPQKLPNWLMLRCRVCCPPHLPQPLHAVQSPHMQSLHLPAHVFVAHANVSSKAPAQGSPPCSACARTVRDRLCCPPPHVTGHPDHLDHSDKIQSRFPRPPPQDDGVKSPGAGLHGSKSLRDLMLQDLPLPTGNCLMTRWRSRMPKQEQLQSDHKPHGETMQSWFGVQESKCGQLSYSSETPTAGRPQWFGCCTTSRVRL
mmetsp:Transcript_53469/g.148661  ORF Transcript_53469/g.148661 Transcript_53469/m.148661 type:complete len:300 (-) Transcript_53469:87-986(-)